MQSILLFFFALLLSGSLAPPPGVCYQYDGCTGSTSGTGSLPTEWTPSVSALVDHFTTYATVTNNNAQSKNIRFKVDLQLSDPEYNILGSFATDTGLLTYSAGETKQFFLNLTGTSASVTKAVTYYTDSYVTIVGGSGNVATAFLGGGTCDTTFNGNAWFQATLFCPPGTSGDPHFYGFKGQKYDVMGQSFEVYNLITSPTLQINSRFIPYFRVPGQVVPTGTMMGELGIRFASHRLFLAANSSIATLDNTEVSLESTWTVTYGDYVLSCVGDDSKHELTIENSDIALTFIRKVYRHSGLDAQWHYDYKANLINANPQMHGLLGQTWETKMFADKENSAFQLLDGFEEDYRVQNNDIFGDEFTYNMFQNM